MCSVRNLCCSCISKYCMGMLGPRLDCILQVWDLQQGKCMGTLTGHSQPVQKLHADGQRLFSIGGRSLRVWDLTTFLCVHVIHLPRDNGTISALAMNPGRMLYIAGQVKSAQAKSACASSPGELPLLVSAQPRVSGPKPLCAGVEFGRSRLKAMCCCCAGCHHQRLSAQQRSPAAAQCCAPAPAGGPGAAGGPRRDQQQRGRPLQHSACPGHVLWLPVQRWRGCHDPSVGCCHSQASQVGISTHTP